MRVLEHEGHRPDARQTFDQRQEPRPDVVDERRLVTPRLRQAEEREEAVDRVGIRSRHAHAVDELAEALRCELRGVVVADARDLADDRCGGRERGALRSEVAPADEDRPLRVEAREELGGQA